MRNLLRKPLPLFLFLSLAASGAFAADPPIPAPAFLDVIAFDFTADGEIHKVVVNTAPGLARVDEATEGYSVIYNPQADFYTGLEHRNYTYWTFSWPEVRASVEGSKRHEDRLQELGNEGLNADSDTPSLLANPASGTSAPAASDDSGYVWHVTTDKKRIGGYDCVRWSGDSLSSPSVDAWCYAGPLPKVTAAIDQLRAMAEPMALVPVRNIAPDFIFPVYASLEKGGVTPLLINWGDGEDKNHFRFIEAKTRPGTMALFTVPKLYVKTTLITMDGMTSEQPALAPRNDKPARTWQDPK
jgi:hypothetical protein